MNIRLFNGLGEIPLFNPDIEDNPPSSVVTFRSDIMASDGIIISSPEYAHGVTGAVKNALDWIVGSGEFVNKPTAILNAGPRSSIAYESLKEIVRTIDGQIVPGASIDVPILGNQQAVEGLEIDPEIARLIYQIIESLDSAIIGDAG